LKLGWQGFIWYAICDWEPNNIKYDLGRRKVNELFNDDDLKELRELRTGISKGEPDLFFYKDDGSTLLICTQNCPRICIENCPTLRA
jgi:hypothetical protein